MEEIKFERTEDGLPIITRKFLQDYWDSGKSLTLLAYQLGISYPSLILYKKKLGIVSGRQKGRQSKKVEIKKGE